MNLLFYIKKKNELVDELILNLHKLEDIADIDEHYLTLNILSKLY